MYRLKMPLLRSLLQSVPPLLWLAAFESESVRGGEVTFVSRLPQPVLSFIGVVAL